MSQDPVKDAILQQLKNLEHDFRLITQDFIDYQYKNREFLTDNLEFTRLIGNMALTLKDLQTYVLTQVFRGDKQK